eukprot:m51a1_g6183 hypothetical protein (253) ;mRNA; f:38922-40260
MSRAALTVLLVLVGAAVVASVDCVATIEDAATKKYYRFDLSSMHHAAGAPDLTFKDYSKNTYSVNVCGETTATCAGQAVCQTDSRGTVHGCGSTSKQVFKATNQTGVTVDKGVIVEYWGGQRCTDGPERHSALIISCVSGKAPTITGATEVACGYTLMVQADAGCGKEVPKPGPSPKNGGGLSAASIILIVLLVVVVIYFAAGAWYQWKFKNAEQPVEFVIHHEFWLAIPLLVKDGACFAAHGFKRGDYTAV